MASASTTFVSDSFTDTPGTLLENHVGEIGATWTQAPTHTGEMIITDANRARGDDTNNDIYYASGIPASADYSVQADFDFITNPGGFPGIAGRMSTSADTAYALIYHSNDWDLYSNVAGTSNELASFSDPFVAGIHTAKLTFLGSTISATIDGAAQPQLIVTDTSISAAGRAGLNYNGTSQTDNSSGIDVDNFVATNPTPVTTDSISDPNIFFSPYNWYISGTSYAQSVNAGAYFKVDFTGTSINLVFDASPLVAASVPTNQYPEFYYTIDNGTPVEFQMRDGVVPLASGLASGTHTLKVSIKGTTINYDRWNVPNDVARITGIQIDSGSVTSSPTIKSKTAVFFGDSITAGDNALSASNPAVDDADGTASYPNYIASGLNAEFGIVGYGGQGWTLPGGDVPPLFTSGDSVNTAWDKYDANHSRLVSGLLSPAPDYIFVNEGTNDGRAGAMDIPTIQAWIAAARAAAPNAEIFLIVPFGGFDTTDVTAGFNNYEAAEPSDTNVFLLNLGVGAETGLTANGPSSESYDGIHPNAATQEVLGNDLVSALDSLFPPAVSMTVPTTGVTISGHSVTLSAAASDNVGVAGVQFKLDTNTNIGSQINSAPYTTTWDSTAVPDGTHTIIAVAHDAAGNYATSTAITVVVDNTPPVISSISAGSLSTTGATITWTTNELSDSQIEYGLTSSYGSETTVNSTLITSHSVTLSGLTASTPYDYAVISKDASGNQSTSTNQIVTTATPASTVKTGPVSSRPSSGGNQMPAFIASYPVITTSSVSSLPVSVFLSPSTPSLTSGSQSFAVYVLQNFLNTHGYAVALTGPGSLGNETTYFGMLTKLALIKFQKAYNIIPAAGYFGPITKGIIENL